MKSSSERIINSYLSIKGTKLRKVQLQNIHLFVLQMVSNIVNRCCEICFDTRTKLTKSKRMQFQSLHRLKNNRKTDKDNFNRSKEKTTKNMSSQFSEKGNLTIARLALNIIGIRMQIQKLIKILKTLKNDFKSSI